MAVRAAALAIAVCLVASLEASAQKVGSWRNQPGTGAIVYDGRGHRIFWDDNGQRVGRYNFHTNRYESIDARDAGVGTSFADTLPQQQDALLAAAPPPPSSPAVQRPRSAAIYRSGQASTTRRRR